MKLLLILLTVIACSLANEETTTEVTEIVTEIIEEQSTTILTTTSEVSEQTDVTVIEENTTEAVVTNSRVTEAPKKPETELLACGCVHPPKDQSCPPRTLPSKKPVPSVRHPPGFGKWRVTAGKTVKKPGDFPWMALMGMRLGKGRFNWFCGGALITDRHVLTAAHCLDDDPEVSMDVARLGELDYSTKEDTSGTVDMDVMEVHIHPKYNKPVIYHDVAVAKLVKKAQFTETIQPVCLPPLVGIPQDSLPIKITVMGWGDTKFNGSGSSILLHADLEMVPPDQCKEDYGTHPETHPKGIIIPNILCAAGKSGQDTCQGDSGGPLVRLDKNDATGEDQYTVFGVVSGGGGCGDATLPGLYTNVQYYLPWILKRLE